MFAAVMSHRPLDRVSFASLALTIAGAACAAPPAASASAAASVEAVHLSPPPGTTLVQACTPTGPELCFNAIDDNCNGVIDEGCGLQTGILQFVIAWGASPADVNLVVVTPSNERVPGDHEPSGRGGAFHLDRDCPGDDGCAGQNLENIHFDGADPPRGHYTVEILLADLRGAQPPVKVHFGARLGSREAAFDVDLAPGEDAKKRFLFELP
jgi:tRNA (guanosine-2'-O-)-methyltransferase